MNKAASTADMVTAKAPSLGMFERYLTLWVALCIVAGVALGQTLPGLFRALGAATVAEVNLPSRCSSG
jgi:arsenite transporter